MTLEELNKHLALLQQREKLEEVLTALRSLAEPGARNLTGLPHAKGVYDRVGDLAVEIADVENTIFTLNAKIERSTADVAAFIRSVEDDQTRIILRLRFIRGLDWKEVSDILGSYGTAIAISRRVYRFLGQKGRG